MPAYALNFYNPAVGDQLRSGRKTATIRLGAATTTDDAEGEVLTTADASVVTDAAVVLAEGETQQSHLGHLGPDLLVEAGVVVDGAAPGLVVGVGLADQAAHGIAQGVLPRKVAFLQQFQSRLGVSHRFAQRVQLLLVIKDVAAQFGQGRLRFIARALLTTCGRNIRPEPKRSPTTRMPSISGPSITSSGRADA